MPAELSRVDELLDDPAFFEPFRPFFHPVLGRKSVPMEMFLRLIYLKYRYRVGFEALCREVADSVSWSRFCRAPLWGSVPDHSTLKKIAKRCGPGAVEELNRALLEKAATNKVLKTNRLWADTTVVPGDVGYPTGLGAIGPWRCPPDCPGCHVARARAGDPHQAPERGAARCAGAPTT